MKYVNLGKTGLKVSQLCLGCMSFGQGKMHSGWTLPESESLPFFKRAIDEGVNFFDTSDAYAEGASEIVLGKAIREFARRDEVVIATKFYAPTGPGANERGASRKHIMAAVDASLKRLNTDYIDLYQQHNWDPTTPLEETLTALDDLVRAGKVLHIGASNYKAWQLAKALQIQTNNGLSRFVSMQVQYNLIYREEEREMIPLCQDQGLGVLAWSSLARGFLAGNRSRDGEASTVRAQTDALARKLYNSEDDFAVQQKLHELAAAKGVPAMQLALAWIAARPGLTAPIIGATKIEQLEQSLGALQVSLDDADMQLLNEAYRPRLPFSFN
ncbi:aryl-alcohol dehydrogenase (NADP+) [Pseudomonas sp. JAI111]|uniref:aldo/keto reductase n=1 Tax=Pseudomonas sp. JAI111 TaxID=2735913 RepID=UPI002169F8A7|nr:aldo/keto reductase [Pseudomonas sp. JAI111]MCS3835693.1 aryl-alcohol dehydrogenase (NADP+) [Pseudomonas sp. JAI111]